MLCSSKSVCGLANWRVASYESYITVKLLNKSPVDVEKNVE